VQDEIDRIYENKALLPSVITLAYIIIAGFEWRKAVINTPPNPWLSTIVAAGASVYTAISVIRARKRIRLLHLARDGERVVAEQLDILKGQGAVVIHDVVVEGFNIDHVILSKKGLFVAETKTRSKPMRGSPTITYDGNALLVNGWKPDRDPVAQAEANARWVAKKLKASSGKGFPVRPVVLFPGWFVEPIPRGSKVWILEPKALPAFIKNEPVRLSDEDLHLAVYHLTQMVRPRTS
jgi:hypothetical protein